MRWACLSADLRGLRSGCAGGYAAPMWKEILGGSSGFLITAMASTLGGAALWMVPPIRRGVSRFARALPLALRLRRGGISRFQLERSDYHGRGGGGSLPTYLDGAETSIGIVSISLALTNQEGRLVKLLRRKVAANDDFRVTISLLNPHSTITGAVAAALDMSELALRAEILDTLKQLSDGREAMTHDQGRRFRILVHDLQPMASAILLDATPTTGLIQVETKLYRARRTESFGFEVRAPSSFYGRNFTAWNAVFDDSREWSLSPTPNQG